jgi:CHASE3 domain sensor protein
MSKLMIVKNGIIMKLETAIKGKTMAEPQETQQEKETRWTAQRAAHDTQQNLYRAARARKMGRNWLIVGAIVIIVAVTAAALLL